MPEMHPSAWHQACEHAEGIGSVDASYDNIQIPVCKNDSPAMEHPGIGQCCGIDSVEPELIDYASVVG
jgi:hypothetical protein